MSPRSRTNLAIERPFAAAAAAPGKASVALSSSHGHGISPETALVLEFPARQDLLQAQQQLMRDLEQANAELRQLAELGQRSSGA